MRLLELIVDARRGKALALALAMLALVACGAGSSGEVPSPTAPPLPSTSTSSEPRPTAGGAPSAVVERGAPPPVHATDSLETEDLVVGTGALAAPGKRLRMTYVGRLVDGTEFDRTLRRPFEFQLGAGEVITGWDRGIEGMRVGGKRRLLVPPDMGYGAHGVPPTIPPNATLVFEVELLDVL